MSYELRKNIEAELTILKEIYNFMLLAKTSSKDEKKMIDAAVSSLIEIFKVINNSISDLVNDLEFDDTKPHKEKKDLKQEKVERVVAVREVGAFDIVLNPKDKNKFLSELNISENYLKKIKRRRLEREERLEAYQEKRFYLKLANKLFLDSAKKLIQKGYFKNLSIEVRRANLNILFESFIAMVLFSTLLSFVFSLFFTIFLLFVNVGINFPFFSLYAGDLLLRALKIFWIPIVIPIITYAALIYYPIAEKKSIASRINQELPFVVIHMSAIAGSGIEPSQIFRIISLNKEYVYTSNEFRKVLNQINLYGYDLVSALTNSAKTCSSELLAELFSGLSITITSGSSLPAFLEKRAENVLLNYKMEREKYVKIIETILDIYISLVIAAPMMFLLLIMMMFISGAQIGLTSFQINLISVFAVAFLNICFLIIIGAKQPGY